jgi:hypothetical protein
VDVTALSEAVDWSEIVRLLGRDGFGRLPSVLNETACQALAEAAPEPWHGLPPEEGIVRQCGQATGGSLAVADAVVRKLADNIVAAISAASAGATRPPSFNEVTWTLYPEGSGHITAHRDPSGVGGVIAIVTLHGTAAFGIEGPSGDVQWLTGTGDVVLLCGNGWPTEETRCPVHVVGPPVGGNRMIMTLRHNKGGAGADYFAARA